jgi:hypothetical protein
MIREAIRVTERSAHKDFVKNAMKGCGMDFEFKKNDIEKGGLDTNYIYINHGKYSLVVSISLPNRREGILTYSTSIDFKPEDKGHPKIFLNANSLDDAINWVETEIGLKIDKKKLRR